MFKSGNVAKNSNGDKPGFKKPAFTIKTKPRKGFEVTDKNGRELAEEIWSKYEMSERQLPRLEDFVRIAKLPIEKIEPMRIPRKQPWKQFNHEWKLRLAQAAQIFSQKWVEAYKIYKKEPMILRAIGLTKSQVSIMIRNNRDTMSRHYQPGSRRNQIESFTSCMEMTVASIALSKPRDRDVLSQSKILERMMDIGNHWDRRQLSWDFSRSTADWELLMVNALSVTPIMLLCDKNLMAMPYISKHCAKSVNFKRSLAFTVQEQHMRINSEAFEQAEVRDLGSFYNGMVVSQSSRSYVLYTTMSRIMHAVGETPKNECNWDLVKIIYQKSPVIEYDAIDHEQPSKFYVQRGRSAFHAERAPDLFAFDDDYVGASDEQIQWEDLVNKVCKNRYWGNSDDLQKSEEIKSNKKSKYIARYPKSHENYGQQEIHEIPENLKIEDMKKWMTAFKKKTPVNGKMVSDKFIDEMMNRFEIMNHARSQHYDEIHRLQRSRGNLRKYMAYECQFYPDNESGTTNSEIDSLDESDESSEMEPHQNEDWTMEDASAAKKANRVDEKSPNSPPKLQRQAGVTGEERVKTDEPNQFVLGEVKSKREKSVTNENLVVL